MTVLAQLTRRRELEGEAAVDVRRGVGLQFRLAGTRLLRAAAARRRSCRPRSPRVRSSKPRRPLTMARRYLHVARSACDFILRDLQRSVETETTKCVSATRRIDRTRVFNASLLAGETLATVGALTGERELCDAATARGALRRPAAARGWVVGLRRGRRISRGRTTFTRRSCCHSLAATIEKCAGGEEFAEALRRGFDFWREKFFLADGWPKYYHDRLYPADAHSAAAGIVTLLKFDRERRRRAPTRRQDCALGDRESTGRTRVLLLPASPLSHRSHALHALVASVDDVCAGAAVGRHGRVEHGTGEALPARAGGQEGQP